MLGCQVSSHYKKWGAVVSNIALVGDGYDDDGGAREVITGMNK